MQKNSKIEDPPHILSQPQVPPSKEFENDCASVAAAKKKNSWLIFVTFITQLAAVSGVAWDF